MLNSFTVVKTPIYWKKKVHEPELDSDSFFYLPHIEMRKVKRNSPITHCIVKSEEMTVDPSIIPQGLSIHDKKPEFKNLMLLSL